MTATRESATQSWHGRVSTHGCDTAQRDEQNHRDTPLSTTTAAVVECVTGRQCVRPRAASTGTTTRHPTDNADVGQARRLGTRQTMSYETQTERRRLDVMTDLIAPVQPKHRRTITLCPTGVSVSTRRNEHRYRRSLSSTAMATDVTYCSEWRQGMPVPSSLQRARGFNARQTMSHETQTERPRTETTTDAVTPVSPSCRPPITPCRPGAPTDVTGLGVDV